MAPRHCTPEEAAALVEPVDTVGVPLGPGIPGGFLHALGDREFTDLTVHGALLVDLYEVLTQPGVHFRSGFFGPAERFLRDQGADISFVPADFRRFATIAARISPRVVATTAAMPDGDSVSLSLHAGATVEAGLAAGRDPDRLLIVEVSPKFPRTVGLPPEYPHAIPLDLIDVLIETDREPIELAEVEPSDTDRAIAEFVAAFVHDGCTLQTGIGGVPSMVARLLAEGSGGDYGVHSEMFTTGLMHLHAAGKVTNARKGVHDGYSVTTFSAGTRELYDWLDGNDEVRFLPVGVVNDPSIIASNANMITINGALAVDLTGQVCADAIGGRQFSGIGGHEDFVAGATLGIDDRSMICLPSTATIEGERISRIQAELPAGSIVTTPRHCVDCIVTEWGVAELEGRTTRERALALIEIAHPAFRDDLRVALARDLAHL